jgi:hypothetical protein
VGQWRRGGGFCKQVQVQLQFQDGQEQLQLIPQDWSLAQLGCMYGRM